MALSVFDEIKASCHSTPSLQGLVLWELGSRQNWPKLEVFLTHVETVVVDDVSRSRATALFRAIDHSSNPFGVGLLHLLVQAHNDSGLPLLKRVLALGANPEVANNFAKFPSELAVAQGNLKCAVALGLCRPQCVFNYIGQELQLWLLKVRNLINGSFSFSL